MHWSSGRSRRRTCSCPIAGFPLVPEGDRSGAAPRPGRRDKRLAGFRGTRDRRNGRVRRRLWRRWRRVRPCPGDVEGAPVAVEAVYRDVVRRAAVDGEGDLAAEPAGKRPVVVARHRSQVCGVGTRVDREHGVEVAIAGVERGIVPVAGAGPRTRPTLHPRCPRDSALTVPSSRRPRIRRRSRGRPRAAAPPRSHRSGDAGSRTAARGASPPLPSIAIEYVVPCVAAKPISLVVRPLASSLLATSVRAFTAEPV